MGIIDKLDGTKDNPTRNLPINIDIRKIQVIPAIMQNIMTSSQNVIKIFYLKFIIKNKCRCELLQLNLSVF